MIYKNITNFSFEGKFLHSYYNFFFGNFPLLYIFRGMINFIIYSNQLFMKDLFNYKNKKMNNHYNLIENRKYSNKKNMLNIL